MANKKLNSTSSSLNLEICSICSEKTSSLQAHLQSNHTTQEIQDAVMRDKANGIPDIEIGQKYGVTFRYIERLITKRKGINVSQLDLKKKIKRLSPKDFQEEWTTVWSFKSRGNWATHSGEYRGNWSPYIPRNVVLKYSKPGETVLDYFCGAGTTAVEAKLLGRKCIAFDINDTAVELAKNNIAFKTKSGPLEQKSQAQEIYEPELFVGDARNLSFLTDNSIDLICAHPPYANIIHYTDGKKGDLSFFDIDGFLREMSRVAEESFRVLKPGRQCAILIGDTRRKKHVIPMGFKLINIYLEAGFKLKELVIKRQHNCKTTGFWYTNSIKYNFLLLAHEYLPIFEKPKSSPSLTVKEKVADYSRVVPIEGSRPIKRRLGELETTTVWILPEKDFEEHLSKNVIDRYSKGKECSTITFVSNSNNETNFAEKRGQGNKELLFVKSPFLGNGASSSAIEYYLKGIRKVADQELPHVNKGGFFVIQTQDVKINGYIEPLAKRIADLITLNSLWLKEIVIITQERQKLHAKTSLKDLKITHKYLLIYEKID